MSSYWPVVLIISFFFTGYLFPQRRDESKNLPGRNEKTVVVDERIKRLENKEGIKPLPFIETPEEPAPGRTLRFDACYYLPLRNLYQTEENIIYLSKKEEAIGLLESEKYYEAIFLFTEVIADNKKDLELYYLRGIAELKYGLYKYAIEDFDYYLKFFDDDGEAYFYMGLARVYYGEKEAAKNDFISARKCGYNKADDIINKYY
jgi:tetratricopeptide (TPR) repeat protein